MHSAIQYIQHAMKNVECHLERKGMKLKPNGTAPLKLGTDQT